MASAILYSASGIKSNAKTTLDNSVFGLKVDDHELLHYAYRNYLDNRRANLARSKTRGEVRGGGAKPWRQKGTGRARHGSRRSPIWAGGGITFGPTGEENYAKKINLKAKRLALRQALSLAAVEGKIKIISTFDCKDGKVKSTKKLLDKMDLGGSVLIVVSEKDDLVERSTRNLEDVKAVRANYLTVYDVVNANSIIISKKSLEVISQWLSPKAKLKEAGGSVR